MAVTGAVFVNGGGPLPGDGAPHGWLARHRSGSWSGAARLVTTFGSVGVAAVVVTVAAGGLAVVRRVRPVVVAVLPVVVALSAYARTLLCAAIGRPRPPRADWLTAAGGDSFPSGHTANATVAYGLLALLVVVAAGRPGRRGVLVGAAVGWGLIAVAVGASRVALGVHWPSDVAAGWAYGIVVLGGLVAAVVRTGTAIRPGPTTGPTGTGPATPNQTGGQVESHGR